MFIKNPDVERAARELARLRGTSLTKAVGQAVEHALALESETSRPRPTIAEMKAATDRFRKAIGLDKRKLNVTKADFDALWDSPGLDPKDELS